MTPTERAQAVNDQWFARGALISRAQAPKLRTLVEQVIKDAIAEEREACAKIVDDIGLVFSDTSTGKVALTQVAEAIRARGKEP